MILIALLMPALDGSTARARAAQCMSNMRQLTAAWMSYAADHDGAIVGGSTGSGSWVLGGAGTAPLEGGLLFPYTKDTKVYQCPSDTSANPHHERTYSVSARLNAEANTAERLSKLTPAATALCFIEENDPRGSNLGSWIINATGDQWIDFVPAWHSKGVNLTFCDGHGEHWTWEDPRTLKIIAFYTTTPNNPDYKRLQKVYRP